MDEHLSKGHSATAVQFEINNETSLSLSERRQLFVNLLNLFFTFGFSHKETILLLFTYYYYNRINHGGCLGYRIYKELTETYSIVIPETFGDIKTVYKPLSRLSDDGFFEVYPGKLAQHGNILIPLPFNELLNLVQQRELNRCHLKFQELKSHRDKLCLKIKCNYLLGENSPKSLIYQELLLRKLKGNEHSIALQDMKSVPALRATGMTDHGIKCVAKFLKNAGFIISQNSSITINSNLTAVDINELFTITMKQLLQDTDGFYKNCPQEIQLTEDVVFAIFDRIEDVLEEEGSRD